MMTAQSGDGQDRQDALCSGVRTMWRCVWQRGWTQTRAGCSWLFPGCSALSSELSGCPGWSSLATSGTRSPRLRPCLLGLLQAEGEEEVARRPRRPRRRRRDQGGLAMEQEIHGLQVEAGGRSWLAEVEVWGGVQGHHLLQTDLVRSKNTTGLRPKGTQASSSYQR